MDSHIAAVSLFDCLRGGGGGNKVLSAQFKK